MLFQTTAAHEELRAKIRSFAEEEIKPLAFMMDQNNEFPEEAVKKLGKLGWMGIPFPKEYGGAGLDALSYAIAVEELARVDGGAGVILSAHVSLGSWPIFAYGTEEQKKKYLVPLAKGEKIGAFGLTEPNAGSDAGGTETTALDKGDYYLLNGGKIFITNAPKADTYVVFAVTTPDIGTRGISAFIVEKGWKGFEFGDHYDKMGIRSSSTAELIFNDVKVPKENLLGKEGEGFKIAMSTLDGGRIGIAAQALGIANPEILKKGRGVAIVLIFFIAAVVTPPDIVSQCMVAIPMVLLYFVSIFLSGIFYKPRSEDGDDEEDAEEEDED